jgi:8-amino-7-oxononanoate synthase
VPPGRSIIRTSVNANHTGEQIERLLEAFAGIGRHLGVIG